MNTPRIANRWTHKVVKMMRGTNGLWFDFPTAATFDNADDAIAYAQDFADQQKADGVGPAIFSVRSRKSFPGIGGIRRNTVKEIRI